jgi:hypothetical protein
MGKNLVAQVFNLCTRTGKIPVPPKTFQARSLERGKNPQMIYTTQRGESFDLEKDFSSPERHILQKLFIWKDMAASVEEFRLKKQEALGKGWGDSGPIQASRNLESITRDFAVQVALRIREAKPGQG